MDTEMTEADFGRTIDRSQVTLRRYLAGELTPAYMVRFLWGTEAARVVQRLADQGRFDVDCSVEHWLGLMRFDILSDLEDADLFYLCDMRDMRPDLLS